MRQEVSKGSSIRIYQTSQAETDIRTSSPHLTSPSKKSTTYVGSARKYKEEVEGKTMVTSCKLILYNVYCRAIWKNDLGSLSEEKETEEPPKERKIHVRIRASRHKHTTLTTVTPAITTPTTTTYTRTTRDKKSVEGKMRVVCKFSPYRICFHHGKDGKLSYIGKQPININRVYKM